MSHKIIEDLPELVALREREAKLRRKLEKTNHSDIQWQANYDQEMAAYEDALADSIENGGPPPKKPEPPPAPDIGSKKRALTEQLIYLRDERKEILRAHPELLEALYEKATTILHGLRDAVRLAELASKELTDLHASINELEGLLHPGVPREDVPTDVLAVVAAVADGRDELPPREPPPRHVTRTISEATS